MTRYEVLIGYNTKQWWVYDNETDKYIDIPLEVLNDIHDKFDSIKNNETIGQQEQYLKELVGTSPSWLSDTDYYFDEIE